MRSDFLNSIGDTLAQLASLPAKSPEAKQLLAKITTNYGLVTREEFDAQSKILAQAIDRVSHLESLVEALEKQLQTEE